jgi:uncharacterized membrane protein YhhN
MQDTENLTLIHIKRLSKMLLMPTLFLYYILSVSQINVWVVMSLLFCWFGDMALMGIIKKDHGSFHIEEPDWLFLLGLGAFLIGHIGYVVFFISKIETSVDSLLIIILGTSILWYGVILIKGVKPNKNLILGVILYMLTIGSMIVSAIIIFYLNISLASAAIMIGAITFGSSDSVLAFRTIKKILKLPYSYIMFSYILGQMLIISGIIYL